MAHVVLCPDSTGKSFAVYLADEVIFQNSRVLRLGRCVADKVADEDADAIGGAVRDIEEAKARRELAEKT